MKATEKYFELKVKYNKTLNNTELFRTSEWFEALKELFVESKKLADLGSSPAKMEVTGTAECYADMVYSGEVDFDNEHEVDMLKTVFNAFPEYFAEEEIMSVLKENNIV